MKTVLKFGDFVGEGRVDVGEVGAGKEGGAEGVAKEGWATSDFSRSVPRILFNVVDSIAEGELALREKIGKWGGAGSGGEKMCFGKSKLYAEGFPEFGKGVNEEGILA
jgi:hypothetical protein